jgi:arginase
MDLAPAAIRRARLAERLTDSGDTVQDVGDVRGFRRRPDPENADRQNIHEVARVADEAATAVAAIVASGAVPLVIGGDCTVTVGAVAGFRRAGLPAAVLYVDGGPDLYTPPFAPYGNPDAMGMAHMLAIPSSDPVLNEIEGEAPLLRSDEVVFYGDVLPEDGADLEWKRMHELGVFRVPASRIHQDAAAAARVALSAVEAAGARFVVHLDVDVLGHLHMPLANMPNPDAEPLGLSIEEVVTSLRIFTASERFAGVVLTEVNPGNAPDGSTLDDYVRMVVNGIGHATERH